MKRVTLVRLLVTNQDEALEFYTKKLGFASHRHRDAVVRWTFQPRPSV
jgi:catechol 2,3-dioxygenase-like lactoylglutathione lyase family enzyme